jgi:hypothetical protein
MTETRDLIYLFTAETLLIVELFVQFLTLFADLDKALEIIRKSPETARLDEADQLRDQTYTGLTGQVRTQKNHFDPVRREAAYRLMILFDHYGNLAQKAPNEETAGIYNIIQELRDTYSTYINVLGLDEWVDELETRNNAFGAIFKARNEETASRSKLQVKQVRKELDGVYHRIVERIESAINLNGPEAYAPFVTRLNAFAEYYNRIIAQRQGQNKAKDKNKPQESIDN